MRAALVAAMVAFVVALAACGGASGGAGASGSGARDVTQIHRARCGSCHVRVEPGTRTRAQLEDAFTRHRKRLHLTEEEWSKMIDYLASDAAAADAGAQPPPPPPP